MGTAMYKIGKEASALACKKVSVSYWNSYWMLPSDVCGMNCFWEAALSFNFGFTIDQTEGILDGYINNKYKKAQAIITVNSD
ncbi:UNVERIFIED_CONTAM: hypothetical protein K2H54_066487 [Gekko kuhli]